jgi:hypothetical protein
MIMKRSFSRYISLLSLLGPLALASPATAQDVAAAEELFNRGLADMQAHRYATGCPAIAESQRLDPRTGTLFTLSQCEVEWGRAATAVTRLGDYLELYERMTPEQKTRQGKRPNLAKEQRDRLVLEVPELTLSLPSGTPAGTVVKRDDAVVAGAALGVRLPVDPGEHVLSTQVPGGSLWEQRITIAKGEKKSLVLEVKAAPPAATRLALGAPVPVKQEAPPPETETGPSGRRVATYIAGGVGAAGIVFGVVTGGLMLSKKSVVNAKCNDAGTCVDLDGANEANSAKALANMSTAGWAVALAGVGTATVLFFTEPPRSKAPAKKGAPQTQVKTSRLSVNIGPVGLRGGFIAIGGAW